MGPRWGGGRQSLPGIVDGRLDPVALERALFSVPLADLRERLAYYRRLDEVWRLIEERYWDSGLRLAGACEQGGISRSRLNQLLRRVTTHTFHSLLRRYRVLAAVGTIWERNYPLRQVGQRNGFGSLSSLERNFTAFLGRAPSEYRRARQEELSLQK